jgi:hypothetical protein
VVVALNLYVPLSSSSSPSPSLPPSLPPSPSLHGRLSPLVTHTAWSQGVLVFVYTPRSRGMGPSIRAACAAAGVFMATLHRSGVLTPQLTASGLFFSTRIVCVSASEAALAAFVGESPCGTASDDDDWFNGDDDDDGGDSLLAAIGVDAL